MGTRDHRSPVRLVVARLGVACLLLGACGGPSEPGRPDAPPATRDVVDDVVDVVALPTPTTDGSMSLERTLAQRRSVREYRDDQLELAEIGQLLWAAQGVTGEGGERTNPSAGALYPMEVYVVTEQGLFRYLPDGHRLEQLSTTDHRPELAEAALGAHAVRAAPAVFLLSGVFARTETRYGDRAERYVLLEAGHVAQSLLLQAVALELGAVPIAAFTDRDVQEVLGLPEDHEPLYLVPVGRRPVAVSRRARRRRRTRRRTSRPGRRTRRPPRDGRTNAPPARDRTPPVRTASACALLRSGDDDPSSRQGSHELVN